MRSPVICSGGSPTRQWLVDGTSRACQVASICGTLPDSMACEAEMTASVAVLLAPAGQGVEVLPVSACS